MSTSSSPSTASSDGSNGGDEPSGKKASPIIQEMDAQELSEEEPTDGVQIPLTQLTPPDSQTTQRANNESPQMTAAEHLQHQWDIYHFTNNKQVPQHPMYGHPLFDAGSVGLSIPAPRGPPLAASWDQHNNSTSTHHLAPFRGRESEHVRVQPILLPAPPQPFCQPSEKEVCDVVARAEAALAGKKKTKQLTNKKSTKKRKVSSNDNISTSNVVDILDDSAAASAVTTAGKKEKVKNPPLPGDLANFSYEDKDRLRCQMAMSSDKENPGPFNLATYIDPPEGGWLDGTTEPVEIVKLQSSQLRQLALNFGCRSMGSATKYQVRLAMARKKEMGIYYDKIDRPNVTSTSLERKLSTIIRTINAIFLPEYFQRFFELNDNKKRQDFEASTGQSNPIKTFWIDIAETVNDSTCTDVAVLLRSKPGEDKHLASAVDNALINLHEYTEANNEACAQYIKDCMKARSKMLAKMKISGEHSNDPMDYLHGSVLKVRKNTASLPAMAVYYMHVMCTLHPKIDSSFTVGLPEHLKADSTGLGIDDDDGGSKPRSKQDTFMAAFEQAAKNLQEATSQADAQRGELLDLHKKQLQEDSERKLNEEYVSLSDKVDNLKLAGKFNVLRSIAPRIRKVEELLRIHPSDSIVRPSDLEDVDY